MSKTIWPAQVLEEMPPPTKADMDSISPQPIDWEKFMKILHELVTRGEASEHR